MVDASATHHVHDVLHAHTHGDPFPHFGSNLLPNAAPNTANGGRTRSRSSAMLKHVTTSEQQEVVDKTKAAERKKKMAATSANIRAKVGVLRGGAAAPEHHHLGKRPHDNEGEFGQPVEPEGKRRQQGVGDEMDTS